MIVRREWGDSLMDLPACDDDELKKGGGRVSGKGMQLGG
jgi:hypothetical protein